jgi:hypothetical protein
MSQKRKREGTGAKVRRPGGEREVGSVFDKKREVVFGQGGVEL